MPLHHALKCVDLVFIQQHVTQLSHPHARTTGGPYAECTFRRPNPSKAMVIVIRPIVFTRHSLVRAKGDVFGLLLLFCSFFCQRFLDNPQANSRHILHAGVLWFRMCLLPFWGLAALGGRKKGEMKFLLLWESIGNFCILAVFERYLSNACTDPHQILFV